MCVCVRLFVHSKCVCKLSIPEVFAIGKPVRFLEAGRHALDAQPESRTTRMVAAWYMDSKEDDPRKPHKTEPVEEVCVCVCVCVCVVCCVCV